MGSYEQLRQSLWDTLSNAQKADSASGRKDHLRKRLEDQTDVIQNQYIPAQIIKLNQMQVDLKEKQSALTQKLIILKNNQEVLQQESAIAQKRYLEKLSESDRAKFEETIASNIAAQKDKLFESQATNLFAAVGQAQLALETANYQDFLSDEGQSAFKVSYSIAKNLLVYKYQFLPKPDDIAYQQELEQITHAIHMVNQAKAIDAAKLGIDRTIAEFVHTQALSTGKSVPTVLQDLLHSDILSVEGISALNSLDLQDTESSISTIQQAIYQQVKNISVANMGLRDIQPVWAPSVPKRPGKMHRMTRNIKNVYHDNRDVIIAAAVLAAVMTAVVMTGGAGAGIVVKFNVELAIGGAGAIGGAVWQSNKNKGQEPTIQEKITPRRYDNQHAIQHYLQETENIAARERQANVERLTPGFNSYSHMGVDPQGAPTVSPQVMPTMAHVPSLANSLFQGGVFDKTPQNFPGPLRSEHLPEALKNPTSTQVFMPFGYQNTNTQPVIAPLPAEQQPRFTSTSSAPGYQNNGNMINGWQNTQHVPATTTENPLGFLPGYSKLMRSETNLGSSSVHQSLPIETVVPQPHIPSLANSVFQGGVFEKNPPSLPGPLRSEHLSEEVKNPQPAQTFIPVIYQDTKQPTVPLRRATGESASTTSNSMSVSPPTQHKPQKPAQSKAAQPKPPKSSSPAAKTDLPKSQPASKSVSVPLPARQSTPVMFSRPPKPLDEWWKMINQSLTEENNLGALAWLKDNPQASPKWLLGFKNEMRGDAITIEQLPRILIEALDESAMDLVKDNVSLDNFLKGQNVQGLIAEEKLRQQSYFMMTQFLGDETARIVAKEKPESLKYAEKFISNFYHSSREDKIKGLVKIGIVAYAYTTASRFKTTRLVSSAFGHINTPSAPLPLPGLPKTFLPNYRHTPTLTVLARHGQRINTTSLGRYNPHETLENQGPIPDKYIKTFSGSTFKSYRLEQDIVLNRVGDSLNPLGQYFSFSRANGAYSDRIDRAILPKWSEAEGPNVVDTAYYIHIPRGTIIHVGKAAPQGGVFLGGTEQVFITKPWDIPGVSVVYKHPIKEAHLWNTKVTR